MRFTGLLLNVACLWAARQRSLNAKAHPLVGCPSSLPCGKATGVRNNLHEAPSASASTQHGADAQTGEPNNSTTYAREEGLEEAKGPLSKFTKQIREAQRVYVCLHDVDVVPKGRSFENNTREGQPCKALQSNIFWHPINSAFKTLEGAESFVCSVARLDAGRRLCTCQIRASLCSNPSFPPDILAASHMQVAISPPLQRALFDISMANHGLCLWLSA